MIKSKFNIIFVCVVVLAAHSVFGQNLVKRTIYKTDTLDFGVGGTIAFVGAPNGSLSIEGWNQNKVEISADIELQANNETDLTTLAKISTFVLEEGFGKITIKTTGAFDTKTLKKLRLKNYQRLIPLPAKFNYKLKVPRYCDLDINNGVGDFSLTGIDGAALVNLIESNAKIAINGGALSATIMRGKVDFAVPSRSWRGNGVEIKLASGDIRAVFPSGLSAEYTVQILKTGTIENLFDEIKAPARVPNTDQSVGGKSGSGGMRIILSVTDGNISLNKASDAPVLK